MEQSIHVSKVRKKVVVGDDGILWITSGDKVVAFRRQEPKYASLKAFQKDKQICSVGDETYQVEPQTHIFCLRSVIWDLEYMG
jgi:hypothetical protein